MNARQVREIAEAVNSNKEKAQMDEVTKMIKDAAYVGGMKISYSRSLLPSVKLLLEKDGYEITFFSDQRDGDFTTIAW